MIAFEREPLGVGGGQVVSHVEGLPMGEPAWLALPDMKTRLGRPWLAAPVLGGGKE